MSWYSRQEQGHYQAHATPCHDHDQLALSHADAGRCGGSLQQWAVAYSDPVFQVNDAHYKDISDVAYHPLGTMLCSTGWDMNFKVTCTPRDLDGVSRHEHGGRHALADVTCA